MPASFFVKPLLPMSSLGARHGHSDGLSLDDADMCRAGTAAHLAAALPRVTYAAGHDASC